VFVEERDVWTMLISSRTTAFILCWASIGVEQCCAQRRRAAKRGERRSNWSLTEYL
jgi:hypothetical protein